MRFLRRKTYGMSDAELETSLKSFLAPVYPEIDVEVRPFDEDPARRAVYFTEKKFHVLYPMQRYHYIAQAIPPDFFEQHLRNTVWFELAPGESVEMLRYPDEEMIQDITPDVMRCLQESAFFEALDDCLCPESEEVAPAECEGDFEISKGVLGKVGFREEELFDIFHVLMAQGAYCDCEILYNVAEASRLAGHYWRK